MARDPGGQRSDPHADVAGALHDVSNALTVLLGWVAEARAPGASPESVAHALAVIEQRARAARDLARRAIGADPAVEGAEHPLEGVLDEVVDALLVEAQRAGVRIMLSGRTAGVAVSGGEEVAQIVTNVVMNALAYAPRGSTVTLEVSASAQTVTVDVADEGPGIARERRGGIFEGQSTRMGGSGLGLKHSRAVARAAGGDLALIPSLRGACFRLTWPRSEVLPLAPPSAPVAPVLQGIRVLVVEDDEHVMLLLETALRARGALVTAARTLEQLLAAVQKTSHDAALIDLSPIATDVEGAIGALRERSPEASLVFISGSAVGLPPALEERSVRWVRKPFEVSELVAVLTSARSASSK